MNAASWPAWADAVAFRVAEPYTAAERSALKAIEQAKFETGRRPRLQEVAERMRPRYRHQAARALERLIRRGRVARGVFDGSSFRDVEEWRKGVRRC